MVFRLADVRIHGARPVGRSSQQMVKKGAPDNVVMLKTHVRFRN